MRLFTAALFCLLTLAAQAGEYRFQCLGEVTGLCDRIYDRDGKETTIKIDFSDRESAAIFFALQQKRIYGTKAFEEDWGIKWKQELHIIGEFTSGPKRTPGGPGRAGSEPYRDFRMTGIKVGFPIWRFQEVPEVRGDDPSSRPVFLEAHFSFDSLFPQGLKLKGRPIDLNKHSLSHRPAD